MAWKSLRCAFLALSASVAFASEPVPDFHLVDVGQASVRRAATVSPRDYVMQVSGYYFGEAT